jgi:hypothetical protein
LFSGERPESKKYAHSFRLLTIRVMPLRITGTLKFNSNPKFKPDSFKYVRSWA